MSPESRITLPTHGSSWTRSSLLLKIRFDFDERSRDVADKWRPSFFEYRFCKVKLGAQNFRLGKLVKMRGCAINIVTPPMMLMPYVSTYEELARWYFELSRYAVQPYSTPKRELGPWNVCKLGYLWIILLWYWLICFYLAFNDNYVKIFGCYIRCF